jgi:choline dehydrogenase-like flavoprotein
MPFDVDVIVVGSGAGGAAIAHSCAKAGKSVFVIERGVPYPQRRVHDEQSMLIKKKPYDDRTIHVNGHPQQLYMGGILGGSTALYGAALMRPSHDDFHPGRVYGDRLPRPQWDWPVGYDDLEPYYTQAESLYRVAGAATDDFGHLPRPRAGYVGKPMTLHPINEQLMRANQQQGLRPFRLPLAIDSERCLRCTSCPGFVCPTGARRSSAQVLQEMAGSIDVLTGVEVEQIAWGNGGEADAVQTFERSTGIRQTFRARRYVLAAGAIGSPLILLRSGVSNPLVGRCYMMHLSPIVVGIFTRRTGAEDGFVKQVGFSDFYFGDKGYRHKLGLVQSLPIPGPRMLAKSASRWLPSFVLSFVRRHMLPLVGIIEDLPNPENRVSWSRDGKPCLHYRPTDYDFDRGRHLGRQMAGILKNAGATACVTGRFASEEHVAHQCGTLRFGVSPDHAVLDPDCRLFGHHNVFVADGSFMPTSLGVGPALTIIANGLRVGQLVAQEV